MIRFNHIQSIPPIRDTNLLSFVHGLIPPSSIYTLGVIQPKPRADKTITQSAHGKSDTQTESKATDKKTNKKEEKKTATNSIAAATPTSSIKPTATASLNDIIYRLNIRVGKITECKSHPTESKMLVSTVDFGNEQRTIVSGIADYVQPDQLINKLVCNIHNVKPGDIKGIQSAGRLLVATTSDGSKKELIEPPLGSELGEQITFNGIDKPSDTTGM